ncbi:MAG: serine hydrolase [Myxococcota bacterium]|nr:serine hydrolase [Myxococcota bacterium]
MMRILASLLVGLLTGQAAAYPLDAYEATGIARLYAFDRARDQLLERGDLRPGSLWRSRRVALRLLDRTDLVMPPPDPAFSKQVRSLLGADAAAYGVAILDLSDPSRPRYAEVNGSKGQQPGSVGKMMVLLAFFQGLADAHPDVGDRKRILRDTVLTANRFIRTDSHNVPVYAVGDPKVARRPIQEGDRANLWTFLDWMASASSNAAASMLITQVMLLERFGSDYPVSEKKAARFFADTSREELGRIFRRAMVDPLGRNGLDAGKLRQGSFFTREGRNLVTGAGSTASASELARYCLLMEQGRLVDRWSSLEIKRLIYLTDLRIRYASSPALDEAAVYFKSGSLYGCRREPGFDCGKYRGNEKNYMNSVAIVETGGRKGLHYVAVVLSNVLRKNSKDLHISMAGEVHRLIRGMH